MHHNLWPVTTLGKICGSFNKTEPMDHFAAFYRTNSRMPGPLSRDSAYESVIPGVIAPPPASYTGEPTGEPTSGAATDYTLTGLEAMEKAGSWAEVGGADDWRTKWLSRDLTGGPLRKCRDVCLARRTNLARLACEFVQCRFGLA